MKMNRLVNILVRVRLKNVQLQCLAEAHLLLDKIKGRSLDSKIKNFLICKYENSTPLASYILYNALK